MTMHDGHRCRLRERFRLEGLENFQPHEVLELLLFYARARGDVNPLAHTLLDTFGSLRGVLEAPVDQLTQVPGIGEETATLLSLMVPMFRRYELCICQERKRRYQLHYHRHGSQCVQRQHQRLSGALCQLVHRGSRQGPSVPQRHAV